MISESTIAEWGAYLILVRTLLGSTVALLDRLDRADGQRDWAWVRPIANAIERLDYILELLPVKAPLRRTPRMVNIDDRAILEDSADAKRSPTSTR